MLINTLYIRMQLLRWGHKYCRWKRPVSSVCGCFCFKALIRCIRTSLQTAAHDDSFWKFKKKNVCSPFFISEKKIQWDCRDSSMYSKSPHPVLNFLHHQKKPVSLTDLLDVFVSLSRKCIRKDFAQVKEKFSHVTQLY